MLYTEFLNLHGMYIEKVGIPDKKTVKTNMNVPLIENQEYKNGEYTVDWDVKYYHDKNLEFWHKYKERIPFYTGTIFYPNTLDTLIVGFPMYVDNTGFFFDLPIDKETNKLIILSSTTEYSDELRAKYYFADFIPFSISGWKGADDGPRYAETIIGYPSDGVIEDDLPLYNKTIIGGGKRWDEENGQYIGIPNLQKRQLQRLFTPLYDYFYNVIDN